ncbi:MAG: serine hydrolase domain-containing protein [Promethearchaeia archaeon]
MNINFDLQRIKKIIKEEREKFTPPGLAVGIFNQEKFIFGKGYGYYDVEKSIPVDLDTAFMIGSITKLFTTVGFMQQWEKGKIKLDDKVNEYLPKGKIITKQGWPDVTFKHLLTHTSGIGELRKITDLFKSGFRLITYDDEPIPPLSSLHDLPVYPASPAGKKWAYSNIGVSLLGYVIEQLSGKSFRNYIIEHILDPLGMQNTDLIRSKRIKPKEAIGYISKRGRYERATRWNNIIKPSGSIVSTVNDMRKFGQMCLQKGEFNGTRLLKPETIDLIWSPHYYSHQKIKDRYAMGFIFRLYNGTKYRIVGHTGGLKGFSATFTLIPENNIGFFTCCNLEQGLFNRITKRLRNRFIKVFTDMNPSYNSENKADKTYWPQIKGYYKGYPGFLTNTRIYTEGIEFKVAEKDDLLYFSSLIKKDKFSGYLYPTEDPLVYEMPNEREEDIYFETKYVFRKNDEGNVVELDRKFEKLRKVNFYQTVRFKFSLILVITTLLCLIIFCWNLL